MVYLFSFAYKLMTFTKLFEFFLSLLGAFTFLRPQAELFTKFV